jgi:hypothetical protein
MGRARDRPGPIYRVRYNVRRAYLGSLPVAGELFQLRRMPVDEPGAQVRRGEPFAVRWRSEMTGNRISVLTR